MDGTRKLAVGAVVMAAAAGGGALAAGAATSQEESQALLNDVAQELGVEPSRLSDALRQAYENRIDEAVEAGELGEDEAAELRERLRTGDVPLLRGLHGPRGHHRLHVGAGLDAAASYLGVTEAELRESLRGGDTLAELAVEEGKSVDGLVDALVAEASERLDAAVEAGRLTEARRVELAAELEEQITSLVNGERPGFRGRFGFHHRVPGGDAA
jgi:transposase-like protein